MSEKMIEEITWKKFKDAGMFWLVNRLLHIFGLAIVYEVENETGKITRVYPATCKFRGFSEDQETNGFINVSRYMNKNSEIILEEALL